MTAPPPRPPAPPIPSSCHVPSVYTCGRAAHELSADGRLGGWSAHGRGRRTPPPLERPGRPFLRSPGNQTQSPPPWARATGARPQAVGEGHLLLRAATLQCSLGGISPRIDHSWWRVVVSWGEGGAPTAAYPQPPPARPAPPHTPSQHAALSRARVPFHRLPPVTPVWHATLPFFPFFFFFWS